MDKEQIDIDAIAELGQSAGPRWSRYFGGAALLVAVGLGWLWLGTGSEPAIKYQTQAAEKTSFVVSVSATGTVEPTNLVEISSELSGTIRAVHADFNSRVTKGEKLAELDTTDPFTSLGLGMSLMLKGDREGAVAAMGRAVELGPSMTYAVWGMAMAEGANGNPEQALVWLDQW